METKNRKKLITLFVFLSLFIGTLIGYLVYYTIFSQKINNNNSLDQVDISFTLVDQNGKKFKSSNLNGSLSLLYLGMTYSLEDCEVLKKVVKIVNALNKKGVFVRPVFITLNPERDRSEVLRKYLATFDVGIIGLTGSDKEIEKLADQLKVYYFSKQIDPSKEDYRVDHSRFVYLISATGLVLKHYYVDLDCLKK